MPKGDKSIPKTHEQFLLDFFKKQPELSNSIKIIGTYKSAIFPILVKTKYGECLVQPSNLLSGKTPTIETAVNKTEYFKNQLKDKQPEIFENVEILNKYVSAKIKLIVKNKHGICKITPSALLVGRNTSIRTAINPTEYWINMAREVHGDLYDYSLVDYKNSDRKVLIKSNKGVFYQIAANHLSGSGCPILSKQSNYHYTTYIEKGLKSKTSKSFKVYIIKCYSNNEVFYKIGKTFRTIENRYSGKRFPYNYEVIKEIEFEKTFEEGYKCCELEHKLQTNNKAFHYTPLIKFAGSKYECFSNIEKIQTFLNQE